MMVFWRLVAMVGLAPALAGCAVGGLAAIGPTPAPTPAAPPPVAYGAFLDGPVGQRLSQADRDKALAAEQDALSSGQRSTWKGEHGAYGYVEPAGASVPAAPVAAADGAPVTPSSDACRAFTSTVYIAGRSQVGHGRGCANPDGSYRIVG